MSTFCEACESAAATVDEPSEDGRPMRVCTECHERLNAFALRPLEWFNLAKRHGWWQFLLHDDFYDEQGTATQPQADLVNPELFPAPTLADVRDDPQLLLDFTITQWDLRSEIIDAWRAFDPTETLKVLVDRYAAANNSDVQGVILSVAACSLGELGGEFVDTVWSDYREVQQLGAFAQASAVCLPHADGFSRVTSVLADLDDDGRRMWMYSLSYFHSRDTLAWIEENVASPVTEDWGRLAAASNLDWDHVKKWLQTGRLISLVALDALAAVVQPQTTILTEYGPNLAGKPTRTEFQAVLNAYAEQDDAPRVTRLISFLLKHAGVLTEG